MKTINPMKTTTKTSCQRWIQAATVLVVLVFTSAQASDTTVRDHPPGSAPQTPVREPRDSDEVACSEDYCKNGGTCGTMHVGSRTALYCECPEKFTGNLCEKEIKHRCSGQPSILSYYYDSEGHKGIKQGEMFTVNCSAHAMGSCTHISRHGYTMRMITLRRIKFKFNLWSTLAKYKPASDTAPRTKPSTVPKNMIISFFGGESRSGMAAGISMTITNATCADQVEYECTLRYGTKTNFNPHTATFTATPHIQGCPAQRKPDGDYAREDGHNDARNVLMIDPMMCLLVMSVMTLLIC